MSAAQNLKRKPKADAFDVFVGNKLHKLRDSLEESQQVFGLRIGVTFQQIQKYERGTNRLSHHHIYDLSQQCKIPMTYFTDGYNGARPEIHLAIINDEPELGRSAIRVARLFNLIKNPKKEKAVLNLLSLMLEGDGNGDGK